MLRWKKQSKGTTALLIKGARRVGKSTVTEDFAAVDEVKRDIYKKLLSDKLSTDLGYVYENAVAQMIRSAGNELFYYTFKETVKPDDDAEREIERNYEIDFLITKKDKICPIEVKSSGYKSHKSLDIFQQKYSARIRQRHLLYTKDLRKEQDIISLPVYMTALLAMDI